MTIRLLTDAPQGWSDVPLKRLVMFTAGATPESDNPEFWTLADFEATPWVAIGDMSQRDVVTDTAKSLTRAGLASKRLVAGPPGTLLFAMYASVGETAFLTTAATWNQAILGLTARPGVELRFVRYALMSLRPYLGSEFRSNTQNNLNAQQVGDLVLPTPPVAEQRAIADFLDRETSKIDALIEKQNEMIVLLLERRSGALAELLDVDAVASAGPRFKHHIASVRQGWSPQCNDWPAENDSWAVLRAGCINGGWFRPWDNKELPDDLEPRRDTVVRVGDLVVSRANTRELVGGAAVVHKPHPRLMLSDKLYAFALRNSANPDFVALVLRTRRYRDLIELEATGASPSMQNITQEVLRSLPMSLPDRQAQDQLVGEATSRMQKTDALIAKAEEFVALG